MHSPEKIALAREVSNWHLFSDKTTDPKPGAMSIEEAEAILADFEEASRNQVLTTLSVFYFGADESHARMGESAAYMIGISEAGACYWIAPDEVLPTQAQPHHFQGIQPLKYSFVRRPDLDDSYPINRLLNGKEPDSFSLGDFVDAGMGNWGFAMGLRQCPIISLEPDID